MHFNSRCFTQCLLNWIDNLTFFNEILIKRYNKKISTLDWQVHISLAISLNSCLNCNPGPKFPKVSFAVNFKSQQWPASWPLTFESRLACITVTTAHHWLCAGAKFLPDFVIFFLSLRYNVANILLVAVFVWTVRNSVRAIKLVAVWVVGRLAAWLLQVLGGLVGKLEAGSNSNAQNTPLLRYVSFPCTFHFGKLILISFISFR